MFMHTLARALLAGDLDSQSVAARAAVLFTKPPRWLPSLAARFVDAFAGKTRPRWRDALAFLQARPPKPAKLIRWLTEPATMQPVAAARDWPLPPITSTGELAEWLGLSIPELDWLADLCGTARPGHYHYQSVAKQFGAARLLEAPKPRLKAAQRQILHEILDRVPSHTAVHGFRKGRSIRTFTAPHTGQPVVLRMDLRDFFPSITRARVDAVFRTLGYPGPAAALLAGLCTNAAPTGGPLYQQPHLPQGAPTSPALANICFHRTDCRLAGLSAATNLQYTRYADDLAFSGAFISENLQAQIGAIVLEEGFTLQYRKTRLMHQGVRQHLAGLTVNAVCNVDRRDFDRLKATLHRCVQEGPREQSRDVLTGHVTFVESINPTRGRKLRALLEQIQWNTNG